MDSQETPETWEKTDAKTNRKKKLLEVQPILNKTFFKKPIVSDLRVIKGTHTHI